MAAAPLRPTSRHHLLLIATLALLSLSLLVHGALVNPSEEDYFVDIEPSTSLHSAISAKNWSLALQYLRSDPDDAGVLVVQRANGARGGAVTERSLPIHKVFSVDAVPDAREYDDPPTNSGTVMAEDETAKLTSMPQSQIDLIIQLLRHHPKGLRLTDQSGRLPLHLAGYSAVSPPSNVAQQMLELYPDALKRADDEGRTPLHAACMAPLSTSELVRTLVEMDVESGERDREDMGKATKSEGGEGAESGTAVRTRCANQALPLHYAAWGGGRRPRDVQLVIQYLVEAYPEGIREVDGDGDVPLDIMVKYGRTSLEAFRWLLAREESHLVGRALEEKEENAQGLPDEEGKKEEVECTTNNHCSPRVRSRRPRKRDPANGVDLCGCYAHSSLIPLDECEGEEDGNCPTARCANSCQGREAICKAGRCVLVGEEDDDEKDEEEGNMKKEKEIEINLTEKEGTKKEDGTLLHSAVSMTPHGKTDSMVEAMLEWNPSLATIRNSRGQLPLHSAVDHYGATTNMIEMLIQAHPEAVRQIEKRTGRLPLHQAVREGVEESAVIARLLEAYPESIGIRDPITDQLPLHIALNVPAKRSAVSKAINPKLPRVSDQVVDILLTEDPSAATVIDPTSHLLPLHLAIFKARPTVLVRQILEASPSAVMEVSGDDEKRSAWHILALVRDRYRPKDVREIAQALLRADLNSAKLPDGQNRLPLHVASDKAEEDRKAYQKDSKRKKGPTQTSGKVLIDLLLDEYPEAAKMRDGNEYLPLHYAVAAYDTSAVAKLLDLYAEGAKDDALLPFHVACGSLKSSYDEYDGNSDAVDDVVNRLLDAYEEAACMESKDGELPLNILIDRPNILQELKAETFGNLVDACPKAAKIKDENGMYPVHIVIRSFHQNDHPDRGLEMVRKLLTVHPDAAKEEDSKGTFALTRTIGHAQGTAKGSESNKALAEISRLLYDIYPEAATKSDRSDSYPLHHLARIVGQTGGSSKRMPPWSQLILDIMNSDATILEKLDDRGRSPLHVLCFHLGDAAVNNDDGVSYERSPEFDDVIRKIIQGSSAVLRLADKDDQTPFYMLNRDLGRGTNKMSATLRFVKDEINKAKKMFPKPKDQPSAESEGVKNAPENTSTDSVGNDEL